VAHARATRAVPGRAAAARAAAGTTRAAAGTAGAAARAARRAARAERAERQEQTQRCDFQKLRLHHLFVLRGGAYLRRRRERDASDRTLTEKPGGSSSVMAFHPYGGHL